MTLTDNTNIYSSPDLNRSEATQEFKQFKQSSSLGTPSHTPAASSPTMSKPKTPLKKEELEKIAKQLKKKLSKASITAKAHSPISMLKSSPLKNHLRKSLASSPIQLSSSPTNLYSPNGKSPTHMRTPAAIYLSSSPLKNMDLPEEDSPTKRRKLSPKIMILEEISEDLSRKTLKSTRESPTRPLAMPSIAIGSSRATGSSASIATATSSTATNESTDSELSLKPSLDLTSGTPKKSTPRNQTTPTLSKPEITNPLLKTPTQSKPNGYADEEGADLLMYLATSPSPAKPFYTPRSSQQSQPQPSQNGSSQPGLSSHSTFSQLSSQKHNSSMGSASSFIAPPPVTPKRHIGHNSRTPNRLTPSMNLFNNLANSNSGLPSSGLTLTPTGFNMNDYVNFFTPSPGHSALSKNLLRTPDFNNLLNQQGGNDSNVINSNLGKSRVDGKVLNFNRVLFGSGNSSSEGTTSKE